MSLSHTRYARFNRASRILMASMAMAAIFALTYSNDMKHKVASKISFFTSYIRSAEDHYGSNTIPGEGALIKQYGQGYSAAVYQIYGGKKRHIPNKRTLDKLYTPRRKIQQISANTLNSIPEGPAYTNGARLIQCGKYPHVYLQTNGQKLWICNPSTFNQFSFAWHKIQKLSAAQCYRICNGPILCNSLSAAVRSPFYEQLSAMGPTCSRNPLQGALVKCRDRNIYQFLDDQLRWIPHPMTFQQLYGSTGVAKVLTYPPGYCAICKKKGKGIGPPLSVDAKLVQCGTYSRVKFLVTNKQKRPICDMKTYRYFNFQPQTRPMSENACKKLCVGETICLSGSNYRGYKTKLSGLGRRCRSVSKSKEDEDDDDWNVGDPAKVEASETIQ